MLSFSSFRPRSLCQLLPSFRPPVDFALYFSLQTQEAEKLSPDLMLAINIVGCTPCGWKIPLCRLVIVALEFRQIMCTRVNCISETLKRRHFRQAKGKLYGEIRPKTASKWSSAKKKRGGGAAACVIICFETTFSDDFLTGLKTMFVGLPLSIHNDQSSQKLLPSLVFTLIVNGKNWT